MRPLARDTAPLGDFFVGKAAFAQPHDAESALVGLPQEVKVVRVHTQRIPLIAASVKGGAKNKFANGY